MRQGPSACRYKNAQVHHTETPKYTTQKRPSTPHRNAQVHHTETPKYTTQKRPSTPHRNAQVHHTETPKYTTQKRKSLVTFLVLILVLPYPEPVPRTGVPLVGPTPSPLRQSPPPFPPHTSNRTSFPWGRVVFPGPQEPEASARVR